MSTAADLKHGQAPVVAEDGASPGRRMIWLSFTLVLASLAALIFLLPYAAGYSDYRKSIAGWLATSWSNPAWQHGALAVPLAAWLVWRRRRSLAEIAPQPSAWGLAAIVFSLLMFWAGYRGNFYYLGYASIQLLAAGLVLWLWGWRHFRMVAFAWGILAFAWPYLFLEDTLSFRLRHFMVVVTAKLLDFTGVPVVQDGTRLLSAATEACAQGVWFNLNVDGPCSGLRSLFALMMAGALFSYFRQRSLWRRVLLFSLSVPFAVVANMARIVVLIFASMAFGMDFAVGRGVEYTSNFHLLTGLLVFAVAFAGLHLAARCLNRLFGREKPLPWRED